MSFIETHIEGIKALGFWSEEHKSVVIMMVEMKYKTEIIREWTISDLIVNRDKVLVKWEKRLLPLTKEELKQRYGR